MNIDNILRNNTISLDAINSTPKVKNKKDKKPFKSSKLKFGKKNVLNSLQEIMKKGSSKEKEICQKIYDVSITPSGKIDILDKTNNHKMYMLYKEKNLTDTQLDWWLHTLKAIEMVMSEQNKPTLVAYYYILTDIAENISDKKERKHYFKIIKKMKKKKCFHLYK